jgi:hypothetical protein
MQLFRKTRGVLVQNNRVLKYCLYAIGEIILVVIGILIALQVNNWNIERTNTKQETNILLQLKQEYTENLREIEQKIEIRYAMNISIRTLIKYSDEGFEGTSLDTVYHHIEQTFYNPTFDGPTGVTDDLLSSGKLYLLKNDELRNLLTNWSGTTIKVTEEEQFMVNHILPKYHDYTNNFFDKRKLSSSNKQSGLGGDLYLNNMVISVESIEKARITESFWQADRKEFSKLINDKIIINYQVDIFRKNLLANDQSFGLKLKIQKILSLIEEGLK